MLCSARRFSPATALAVAALIGSGLAAGTATAQVPGTPSAPSTVPTATPTPTPTPNTPAVPTQPAGPGNIAIPENSPPIPPGPQGVLGEAPLSLNVLEQQLQQGVTVNGGAVGWAYHVTKDGQFAAGDAGGMARTPLDGNADQDGIAFTVNTRIELMSATKPITAMATLKALHEAGVSVDAPVRAYLPASWAKGKGFKLLGPKVTFRHLLTHTSGILQAFQDPNIDQTGWGNTWAGLEPIVAQGVTPNVAAGPQYKNANYALLRVMLPKLWAKAGGPQTAITAANHGYRFKDYVNAKILAPAGVAPTSCWSGFDSTAAHVYNKGNLGIGGTLIEYSTNPGECGGHRGLHLSAADLTRLTSALRQGNAVLPAAVRAEMFAGRLGWSPDSNLPSKKTAGIWWHGGDGFFGGGREVHTCVMNAPQGYQLSLIMNSQRPGNRSQCRILLDAVQAARTAE